MPSPLGWIPPSERSKEMHDAHHAFVAKCPKFALARPTVPKGTKIILTSAFDTPEVQVDLGYKFTGFRQLTGSCVGVSTGNAIATLSAIQRLIADSPQKAIVPFWGFDYGRSRANAGMRGQGEGSVDSIMGQTLIDEGVVPLADMPSPPTFDQSDGFAVSSSLEMAWSDGQGVVQQYASLAKQFPLGSMAPLADVDGIATSLINGYPVLDGCNYFVGQGRLNAQGIAIGDYSGRGGHSTCFLGYWEHETLGPLYLYSNQWDGTTYPDDNTGKFRCSVWMLELSVRKLFQYGGDGGETMSLSHLTTHPAQPKLLDWMI